MLTYECEADGVKETTRLALFESLEQYRMQLVNVRARGGYSDVECPVNLPFDEAYIQDALTHATALHTERLRYVILVGIGGSNLGAKAVYDALGGAYDSMAPQTPQLVLLDMIDIPGWSKFLDALDNISAPEELAVCIISKSGTTTETIYNTEMLYGALARRWGHAACTRIVCITDANSALACSAQHRHIRVCTIPALVGGRFSVFSAVGIVPLALLGINTKALLKGAQESVVSSLADDEQNIARTSAISLFANYLSESTTHDMFVFDRRLHTFGLWYRQLLGESVGKEKNKRGEVVRAGILPIVSLGSVDLHSVGQLYLGGPKNIYTTFVSVEKQGEECFISDDRLFPELVPSLAMHSAKKVHSAIFEGTRRAYAQERLPHGSVTLTDIDAYTLGALLQTFMVHIMYLGALMNVNTFDQPNVESYKMETRRILETA